MHEVGNLNECWNLSTSPLMRAFSLMCMHACTVDGDVISTGPPAKNIFDAIILTKNWGPNAPFNYPPADINWDGTVNIFDALILMT